MDNQTYGPYSGQEIEEFAEDGRIKATDLLCPEGGSAWIEAKNEPTFGSLFPTHHGRPATAYGRNRRRGTNARSNAGPVICYRR